MILPEQVLNSTPLQGSYACIIAQSEGKSLDLFKIMWKWNILSFPQSWRALLTELTMFVILQQFTRIKPKKLNTIYKESDATVCTCL